MGLEISNTLSMVYRVLDKLYEIERMPGKKADYYVRIDIAIRSLGDSTPHPNALVILNDTLHPCLVLETVDGGRYACIEYNDYTEPGSGIFLVELENIDSDGNLIQGNVYTISELNISGLVAFVYNFIKNGYQVPPTRDIYQRTVTGNLIPNWPE